MNLHLLKGRLGKDPELKYTPTGKPVTTFSLATTKKFRDAEETTWHNIVCWNKTAEIASKYLRKGQEVLVSDGELRVRSWDDKDGKTHYRTETVAHKIEFIGNRVEAAQTDAFADNKPAPPPTEDPKGDSDLPF